MTSNKKITLEPDIGKEPLSLNWSSILHGKKENPWDIISELQTKVDSLNDSLVELEARTNALEEESKVKILRFLDPMEYNQSEATWKKVTTFSWVPNNQTDNAILSVTYYAVQGGIRFSWMECTACVQNSC